MTNSAEALTNREAVAKALRDNHAQFRSFVRSRVRPEDVDDILQVAALRAIERADTIEDQDRVIAWLYRIHRNLIADCFRKRSIEQRMVDTDAALPEKLLPPSDDPCTCSLSQAKRLRPSYAAILSLVDTAGVSLGEAARQLDVTPNNAAVRLHRARKALKQAMLEHCGVQDISDCASCRCVDDICCAA